MNEDVCWKYENEMVFEEGQALAFFLKEEVVFLNTHWYEEEWTEEQKSLLNVIVNCNDVFAWACADGESITYNELGTLWQYYCKDPKWGPAMWCITKRKWMPQKPVYEAIQKEGIWNLDTLKLK